MYAGMRRVPAERARHAKRLGHVQAGPGPALPVIPINTTTVTTQSPTTSSGSQTVISASRSSSSAPSSTSTIPSSSSTHSTTSATSTSPTPSSTTAQSLALSSPTDASPTIPLSSSTPTSSSNVAAATSSGLSGGAIAGIIAGAAVVAAVFIVFLIRKTYLRRREHKRISWSGVPGLGTDISDEPKPHFPDISERPTPHRNVPPSPFVAHGQPMQATPLAHLQPPTTPIYATPTPPPATYNNPTPVGAYPAHRAPSVYSTGMPTSTPPIHVQNSPPEAVVKCTFVPTLPDELSITTGERILILEQYDDGWNLCANARGERGMVPRDCLDHITDQPDIAWRNAERTSSLNPDGRY